MFVYVQLYASPFLRLREHFVATVAESGHHDLERAGEDCRSPGSYLLPGGGSDRHRWFASNNGGRSGASVSYRWRISAMNDPVDKVHSRPLPLST